MAGRSTRNGPQRPRNRPASARTRTSSRWIGCRASDTRLLFSVAPAYPLRPSLKCGDLRGQDTRNIVPRPPPVLLPDPAPLYWRPRCGTPDRDSRRRCAASAAPFRPSRIVDMAAVSRSRRSHTNNAEAPLVCRRSWPCRRIRTRPGWLCHSLSHRQPALLRPAMQCRGLPKRQDARIQMPSRGAAFCIWG